MGSVVVGGKHRPKYAQNDACHPCAGHFNLVRGLRLHLLGSFEQFKEEKNSNDQHKWTLRDQQQPDCPRRQGRVAGRRRRRRRW